MFRSWKLKSIEQSLLNYIQDYFNRLSTTIESDYIRNTFLDILEKSNIEPSVDTLSSYFMGSIMGCINYELDLQGLSENEKVDTTESLYRAIQLNIVSLREILVKIGYK